jgi:DNA invertase Pin-like site-specific DNA recombinase
MGVVNRNITRVMVWDVSRLGRSLQDLISTMKEIQAAGANLYLHNQSIDTSTPAGEAVFGMLAVFASFERSMINGKGQEWVRSRKAGREEAWSSCAQTIHQA